MTKQPADTPVFEEVPLNSIRNRNEKRLLKAMQDVLSEEASDLSCKDIQDIYALALNQLPAHYAHDGTIVLRPNATKEELCEVVRQAAERVRQHAKD